MNYDSSMKKEEIKNLYEELVKDREAYEDNLKKYPVEKIETFINDLGIFEKPVGEIMMMSQDDYSQDLSDNRFSFDFSGHRMDKLMDRIIINHTDGSVNEGKINLTYSHEDPYESGQYNVKTDFNIIQYGMAILSALSEIVEPEKIVEVLSPDATVSLMLACKAIKETGRG
ncbi:hypothetical protein [Xylocopilactobacillus apis]|uniref:Uncharacterized protein n=1 Tax=Xylocopilactobacillus apis TaxID=2932183 RepID=A0AAU9CYP2_9LACO|nr:hypothetical protein [Xylocopilactobacillus apis]BDR57546.1 hypothetical protein KIMC2_21080 [Xylocopilactobacillus apis]